MPQNLTALRALPCTEKKRIFFRKALDKYPPPMVYSITILY